MSAKSTPTGTSCRLNAPATTGAEAIPPMFAVLATAMLKSSVFVSFAYTSITAAWTMTTMTPATR